MKPAPPPAPPQPGPLLHDGDRLTQKEFHRRYAAYPKHVKFELIGGVVHMASPLGEPHGDRHVNLSGIFWLYQGATPGVRAVDNATTILGEQAEPQPDLSLRILREYGGQSRVNDEGYLEGAPELIAEVAASREAIALGAKRADYERAGVLEYLVVCLREQEIHWFDFRGRSELRPTRQGVFRSRLFAGLWVDRAALLAGNTPRLIEVVQQGIASRQHTAFVARLAREHRRLSGQGGPNQS
jgi:hypothetical protein